LKDIDLCENINNICKLLISKGININHVNNKGKTALFYAAKSSNDRFCKILISNGININHVDNKGRNALFYAIDTESESEFACAYITLIDNGINIDQVDNDGNDLITYTLNSNQLHNDDIDLICGYLLHAKKKLSKK
jgi:ankyrin repeat protein